MINREAAIHRSDLLLHLRRGLHERGFVEVNTPVLIKGGVNTQLHLPQGISYALRDCMELRLRSALSSGLPRVYEIGPCFRMGDSDDLRHPEFYMMELFGAKLDHADLVELARGLFVEVGCKADSFNEISVAAWLMGLGIDPNCPNTTLRQNLISAGHVDEAFLQQPTFRAVNDLIDRKLQADLRGWTVLKDFPKCTVCLAKPQSAAAHLVERFEIFWDDIEVAHGFVDDGNATDVEERMIENGPEFHDEGFLRLLRAGTLPQSGGLGIGIERLLMARSGARGIGSWLHLRQF